jgi:hypothetical protein
MLLKCCCTALTRTSLSWLHTVASYFGSKAHPKDHHSSSAGFSSTRVPPEISAPIWETRHTIWLQTLDPCRCKSATGNHQTSSPRSTTAGQSVFHFGCLQPALAHCRFTSFGIRMPETRANDVYPSAPPAPTTSAPTSPPHPSIIQNRRPQTPKIPPLLSPRRRFAPSPPPIPSPHSPPAAPNAVPLSPIPPNLYHYPYLNPVPLPLSHSEFRILNSESPHSLFTPLRGP